ncbi:hypothetical protein V8E51_010522 [Hyaloscypha variabilis]
MGSLDSKTVITKKVEDDQVSDKMANGEETDLGLEIPISAKSGELKATCTAVEETATTQICFITKLPNELLFKIIDELHPVESTCLGLTCKALYTLHGAKNPKVRLWNYVP